MTLAEAYRKAAEMRKDDDLDLRPDELACLDALEAAARIAEKLLANLDRTSD